MSPECTEPEIKHYLLSTIIPPVLYIFHFDSKHLTLEPYDVE